MSTETDRATARVYRPPDADHRARTTPVAATWDYIAFDSPADFRALTEQYDLTAMGVTGMIPAATPFAWTAPAEPTTHLILATERNPLTGARRTGDDRGWVAPTHIEGCEVGRVYLAGPRYAVAEVGQTLRATAETIHGPARPLTPKTTTESSEVGR
jgi:hypothetical protein